MLNGNRSGQNEKWRKGQHKHGARQSIFISSAAVAVRVRDGSDFGGRVPARTRLGHDFSGTRPGTWILGLPTRARASSDAGLKAIFLF